MAEDRPIFAIFEGGGAKGVAHVGAMKAAEENRLEFIGVAGSSAGAIIATLVAAGISADNVLDPEHPETSILRRYGKTPVDLFGETRWRRFGRFYNGMIKLFGGAALVGFLSFLINFRKSLAAVEIILDLGYFSTDAIRELVNEVLRDRLKEIYPSYGLDPKDVPPRITFKDLDHERFAGDIWPLKIVATNLKTGDLVVFERELTEDVEVAEAVAASIAIPIVFKPVKMQSKPDGGPYLDGGLVSNLPIWVFTEEKLAWERDNPNEPPIPIVGFSLSDKKKTPARIFPLAIFSDFLVQVVKTALSGSQTVSQKFIEDLEVVKLETEFGLLDFDKPWPDFQKAYLDGKHHADKGLMTAIILRPELMKSELRAAVDDIKSEINRLRITNGLGPLVHCRGNLILPIAPQTLRVKYGVNMEGDTDDRLVLDGRGNGAAEAFRTRGIVFQDFEDSQAFDYMRKYEKRLVRKDLKGAICVPIFGDPVEWTKDDPKQRSKPLGVFCFDSDEDLKSDYKDQGVRTFIVTRSAVLYKVL